MCVQHCNAICLAAPYSVKPSQLLLEKLQGRSLANLLSSSWNFGWQTLMISASLITEQSNRDAAVLKNDCQAGSWTMQTRVTWIYKVLQQKRNHFQSGKTLQYYVMYFTYVFLIVVYTDVS